MDVAAIIVEPVSSAPVLRRVTISVTREGQETTDLKMVRMVTPGFTTLGVGAFFHLSSVAAQSFLASAVDGVEWMFICEALTAPRLGAVRIVQIGQDLTLAVDLSSGGGSGGGVPAALLGVVRVERFPARREVVAIDRGADGSWRVAGYGVSSDDGIAELDLRVTPGGSVYAVASDDFGVPYQAELAVQVGQRIRPAQYAGWVYEITEAGQLPSAEPEWWAASGDNPSRPLGTARAVARRYFQPIAHGPVPVEVT